MPDARSGSTSSSAPLVGVRGPPRTLNLLLQAWHRAEHRVKSSRGERRAAPGGQARRRSRAVAADRDKAALSPRYPFLGHVTTILT